MNAIEIRNLRKSFRGECALEGINMTVPAGAIYGLIGENGSGKSTIEKLICGQLDPDSGKILFFNKGYKDEGAQVRVGALVERADCFPYFSVYQNLMIQAIALKLTNPFQEIRRVLGIVQMEEHSKRMFKKCSDEMKQRVGIAMALLGNPALLILDEPVNGLDTDGIHLMKEILEDITQNYGCTVLISSHTLGELETIATHYGVIRRGKMIREMSAAEMEGRFRNYITLRASNMQGAFSALRWKYSNVKAQNGLIRVYDVDDVTGLVDYLREKNINVIEIKESLIGLEEYYKELMSSGEDV